MRIVSLIQRPGGTEIPLDGKTYKFKPDPAADGAHIAEVEDMAHIKRLLKIREGFAPAPGEIDPRMDEDQAIDEIAARDSEILSLQTQLTNALAERDGLKHKLDVAATELSSLKAEADGLRTERGKLQLAHDETLKRLPPKKDSEPTSNGTGQSGGGSDPAGPPITGTKAAAVKAYQDRFKQDPPPGWTSTRILKELAKIEA